MASLANDESPRQTRSGKLLTPSFSHKGHAVTLKVVGQPTGPPTPPPLPPKWGRQHRYRTSPQLPPPTHHPATQQHNPPQPPVQRAPYFPGDMNNDSTTLPAEVLQTKIEFENRREAEYDSMNADWQMRANAYTQTSSSSSSTISTDTEMWMDDVLKDL
jgi:hypothetical protein